MFPLKSRVENLRFWTPAGDLAKLEGVVTLGLAKWMSVLYSAHISYELYFEPDNDLEGHLFR